MSASNRWWQETLDYNPNAPSLREIVDSTPNKYIGSMSCPYCDTVSWWTSDTREKIAEFNKAHGKGKCEV